MDQTLFKAWLSEVAVLKEVKIARDPKGSRLVDEDPATELVVDHTLPLSRSCAYCDKQCSGCMNHAFTIDKKSNRREWTTQCDTCKKKVDLKNGRVIENPNSGKGIYYIARGLRTAKPGNKLGRPRKDFWNEPVEIFTEEQARDHYLRRADLLDRLETLRKSTKDDK